MAKLTRENLMALINDADSITVSMKGDDSLRLTCAAGGTVRIFEFTAVSDGDEAALAIAEVKEVQRTVTETVREEVP